MKNKFLIALIATILTPVLAFAISVTVTDSLKVGKPGESVRYGYFYFANAADNYTTGGETVTAANFNFNSLKWVDTYGGAKISDNTTGFRFEFIPDARTYSAAKSVASDNTTGCTIDNRTLIKCDFTTAHGFSVGDTIKVAGFTTSKYNGDFTVSVVDNTTRARWKITDMIYNDNISRTNATAKAYSTASKIKIYNDNGTEITDGTDLSESNNGFWRVFFKATGF